MKFIFLMVFLVTLKAFGACPDLSGHYIYNPDGYIPVTFEITQRSCEHLDFLLKAPTVGFRDTRSINPNGVFATLKVDDHEKVEGSYKFEGDVLLFTETILPKDGSAPYTNTGSYFFSSSKTLMNNYEMVRSQQHSKFSFLFVRAGAL